jgi:AraC-like DNA-binding protein
MLCRHRVLAAPHRGFAGSEHAGDDAPGLVLPASGAVPLVITLEDSAHRPRAFAHGVHAEHSALPGPCAPLYLEVWIAPLAAARVLGVPMDELADRTVELDDLVGADGHTLVRRVREEPDWARRRALVDDFLLRRWDRGRIPPAEVREAWAVLVAHRGDIAIGDVARAVGWSHQHLTSRFHRWVGMPPKKIARILRLEALGRSLASASGHDWSHLAARHGYADQAHLIRETRALTGATPVSLWGP